MRIGGSFAVIDQVTYLFGPCGENAAPIGWVLFRLLSEKKTAVLLCFFCNFINASYTFLRLAIYTFVSSLFSQTAAGTRQAEVCSFYHFWAECEEMSQRHGHVRCEARHVLEWYMYIVLS